MNIPENYRFLKSHEWAYVLPNGNVRVGISDYAQSQLGTVVYVSLPAKGDNVTADESFAEAESVKAVSEIFSPVSGEIVAVNSALEDAPESINEDAFEAWIIEVRPSSELSETMSADDYAAYSEAL